MASPKIVLSDLAPNEPVHFDLAGEEFTLGGGGDASHETTNREVLGNAEIHPWLRVEYPAVEGVVSPQRWMLADHPEQDGMSARGPNADDPYDPEKVREAEEEKAGAAVSPLAVDANLDQDEPESVKAGEVEVAVTLAADEEHEAAESADAFTAETDTKDND